MKQILSIFRKDTRLFYPEVLLSLAILVAYTWLYPQQWGAPGAGVPHLPWLPGTVTGLLPFIWLIIIARIVHAESLVGHRQYWITRPYRWPLLLAAKALFLFVFIYIPFFIALCVILHEAGMPVRPHIAGLLSNLLMATVICFLPFVAVATVTSNLLRLLLAVLMICAFVGLVAYSTTFFPSSSSVSDSLSGLVTACIFVAVLVAIVVVQYARRDTALARLLMAALAITLALYALFEPVDTELRTVYPTSSIAQRPWVELAIAPHLDHSAADGDQADGRETYIQLPLNLGPIKPYTAIAVDFVRLDVTATGGQHWQSRWQGQFLKWRPGQDHALVSVNVNRKFADRIGQQPVSLQLTLALTRLDAGQRTTLTLPEGEFALPLGGSLCARAGYWGNYFSCRSPLRQPPLMLLGTRFSKQPCPAGVPAANDADAGIAWVGNLNNDLAEFGLTSVWTTNAVFESVTHTPASQQQYLCPGSPLVVVPYTVTERRQQQVTVSGIRFDQFVRRHEEQ